MSNVIVCTYCDEERGMLDEYRNQVLSAGIAFHLELISPFPHPSNLPLSFKLHWMRQFATDFPHASRLIFTDAYDVLFVGTREDLDSIPEEVQWAAERNCYPEPALSKLFYGVDTPWRYVNAGLMSGSPEAILDWVADAERHPDYDPGMLDQGWLNRRRVDTVGLVQLDHTTRAFYVMSKDLEGGELQAKNGRPWNSVFDTFPVFFHFSGHCDTTRFRMLLNGES